MISPDLLFSAARTRLLSQLSFSTSMAESMIETMEKLMGLNLQAAKASLDMSTGSAQQLMGTKDAQDFLSASGSQLQPQADIVMTYVRHLTHISSSTHLHFARITQDQFNDNNREVMSLLDELGSSAPEGSQNSISLLKSAINQASSGYDQITKTTQSAIEQLESSISAVSSQLTAQTTTSNGRSKK